MEDTRTEQTRSEQTGTEKARWISKFFSSLRSKLILLNLFMLVIPSLITGLIGYQVAHNQLNKSSEIALKNDVRLVNATIEQLNTEVVAGKIPLSSAQELVKEMILGKKEANGHRPINPAFNLGKNGYFFILNNHAVEVAHPTLEGKSIWNTKSKDGVMVGQQLVKQGLNGGGFTTYEWPLPNSQQEAMKIAYSQAAPAWGWIVAAGSYMSDYNSGANQILDDILITLLISVVLGGLLTLYLATRIARPVIRISEQVEKVASGDLTIEPAVLKSNDEIGRLARGFAHMTANLRTLIASIHDTSQQVAAASEELTASSEQTSRATESIATTMQEMATGTESQAHNVEESAQSVQEMAIGIEHISSNAQMVSDSAVQATQVAEAGNHSVRTAVEQMDHIHSSMESLASEMRVLGSQSDNIGKIVQVISDISSQTNLLALNAAIEAARAGEHGRGFAVVADEVRKLAEQSSASAKQIAEVVGSIQNQTGHAVGVTQNVVSEVQNGLSAVNSAGASFEEIRSTVGHVATQIQEVSAAVEQMLASTEGVVQTMRQIGSISENISAGTQNVSAAAEEQLASMEEISASSAALAKMATELQEAIGQFKI